MQKVDRRRRRRNIGEEEEGISGMISQKTENKIKGYVQTLYQYR